MKLIIAEKKSVAQSIASALGVSQNRGGYIEVGNYLITWCAGHLLELAAPSVYNEKYSKWRYTDLPIIPVKWEYSALKGKEAQLKIIVDLMKRADVECIINACDAGREGENIFCSVYTHAKCNKKILRLWISSMEASAIKAGFDNLIDGKQYDNLSAAAACRERADWMVGISATRLFSVLYNQTLNTGRVQSPTLAMIVKRDADIASFIKEPFYMINIENNGISASSDRLKDKQAAETIRAVCDGKAAVIKSVERQIKNISPPKLYDLTSLQRDANRLFGFTAAQTLEYAQSMYENAILSYPRTDSRYLTSDMSATVAALIGQFQNNSPFVNGTAFIPDIDRIIDDKRVTDHHAIIPTAEIFKADISALSSGARDVLNLVISRLLCAVAPTHSYEVSTVILDCEGHIFSAKGKTIITDGWKAIETSFKHSLKQNPDAEMSAEDEDDNYTLPEISEGQTLENITASVKQGMTTPPKPFTEDALLLSMETAGADDMPEDAERRGLGTPATRAAIIEKLISTGFIERKKKNIISTDKGKNIIAVLPDMLTSPKLTAEWEHKLMQIQRGELSGEKFMKGIAAFITEIVKENSTPNLKFKGMFGGNKNASEQLGECPRCGNAVRENENGYFCDNQTCFFKLWKRSKFWTAKKRPLTADIVTALLNDGKIALTGLYSEKTRRKYDGTIVLDDTGEGFVNFKMQFK